MTPSCKLQCEGGCERICPYVGGSHLLQKNEDGDKVGKVRYQKPHALALPEGRNRGNSLTMRVYLKAERYSWLRKNQRVKRLRTMRRGGEGDLSAWPWPIWWLEESWWMKKLLYTKALRDVMRHEISRVAWSVVEMLTRSLLKKKEAEESLLWWGCRREPRAKGNRLNQSMVDPHKLILCGFAEGSVSLIIAITG